MSDSTLEENIDKLFEEHPPKLSYIKWREGDEPEYAYEVTDFTQALLSLYQKELESRVHEEVGRILFTLPPDARKRLQPLFDAGLKSLTREQQ